MQQQPEPGAAHGGPSPDSGGPRPDPTKMINQPALQRSRGTVWIVVAGLFLLAALVPFGALGFAGSGRSAGVAIVAGSIAIALYLALVIVRFAISEQRLRLRVMAACMLTMAFVSLVGVIVCAMIEWAGVVGAPA